MTMNGDTLTETTSGGGQNPLSAKVTQILGTSYTDYAVRSALENLSLQFTENTPSSRRQLRANLELQDIQSAGALLEQYEQVLAVNDTVISADILVKSLDNLKANVAQVTETCKIMQLHTTAAAMQISRSLADAELLQSRRDQIGTKHTILSAFQDVFTLPEEQIILLTSTSEPVDERFFDIFDKVKTIHSSCQSLLTTENNRAGIEIMDQMNRHLDFAFQKLFTWIQRLFKSIQYESPEVDPIARRAIRTLAERPALFQKCLDAFSEMRRKVVLRDFMEALTQGENTLSARAIDFQAHDPLRYLGDILAWTHQAVASEKEILTLIFGVAANSKKSEFEPGNERWLEDGTILSALDDLIETDLEGTCRPIQSRIQHLISSQENPTILFRIAMLLRFYRQTLTRMLKSTAQVVVVIANLERSAMRQFHLLMSEKIHTIAPSLDEDLGCPVFLLDAISDLRVILGAYESSFVPASDDYQEISAIFNSALQPYLQQCEEIAKSFPELLQCIILSNCIDLVKMTLKLFSSAKNELDALNSKSRDIEQRLILEQHSFFLDSSGLRPFLKALDTKEKDAPLSRDPQFSTDNLDALSRTLEEFLPNALVDGHSRLQRLTSPRLASTLTHEAASLFVDDFAVVKQAVQSNIELSQTVFPRSVDEVKLLLGF